MEDLFRACMPFWMDLSETEKKTLLTSTKLQTFKAGIVIPNSTDEDCPGIRIVKQGRVRVYISSPDGKQLTLYRMPDSSKLFIIGFGCVLDQVIFAVNLETETECEIALIPREVCKRLYDTNVQVKTVTVNMLADIFSSTMRVLESVAFSSIGNRLAGALLEQSALTGSSVFKVTHEKLAADIGSAREVVTRQLKQFQLDGLIKYLRGKIEILDRRALEEMCYRAHETKH